MYTCTLLKYTYYSLNLAMNNTCHTCLCKSVNEGGGGATGVAGGGGAGGTAI